MKGLLLDTHILIWAASDPGRLSKSQRKAIRSTAHPVYVSAISTMEIEIKKAIGKLRFDIPVATLCDEMGFLELPLTIEHAEAMAYLPRMHSDPFDRALLAQAKVEGLHLATRDKRLKKYPGKTL